MLKIIHRVNTIEGLEKIDPKYGVEVDLRAYDGRLILNHEAFEDGQDFEKYLEKYQHSFLILNIKESGIEDRVVALMKKRGIEDYFLLDVEFPYMYKAAKQGFRKVAIRYSEKEPIENVLEFKDNFDWVWIDTNTKLPLDSDVVKVLKEFKTCLVCPERWGRSDDIENYVEKMKALEFEPTAVMTSLECVDRY